MLTHFSEVGYRLQHWVMLSTVLVLLGIFISIFCKNAAWNSTSASDLFLPFALFVFCVCHCELTARSPDHTCLREHEQTAVVAVVHVLYGWLFGLLARCLLPSV